MQTKEREGGGGVLEGGGGGGDVKYVSVRASG